MSKLTSTFVLMFALIVAHESGQGGPDAATSSNQFTILVTTVAGFAGLIATQVFALWRENRNRQWDLQDREMTKREMRQHAETQRIETIQTAVDLAKISHVNRQQMIDRIDDNTQLTRAAKETTEATYVATSSYKEKLEELRKQLSARAELINHIDVVGTDTNKKVDVIKDDLKKTP